MRVPVRHPWTIALVFAVFVTAMTSAGVTYAQSEHATTPQAPPAAGAAEHQTTPAPAAGSAEQHQAPAAGEHNPAAAGAEGEEAAADHSNPLVGMIAKLFNFVLLAGTLVYFLRSPLAVYLSNRSSQIRERLVKARELRAGAAAEQAAVAEKMKSLPAELAALSKAGAEEIEAEEARIRQAAEAERARLLELTDRDINTQLKLAERALTKQAADLAVAVAAERVKTTITDADQIRLVDRYLIQVGSGNGV
jgi:F0F1-type ATP synthase membrane subunit b/b'